MKYLITISTILITFLGCTDKEKDFIPTNLKFIIENKTNNSIKIESYLLSVYQETHLIGSQQEISVIGTNGDPSDGLYIPPYVRGDSVLIIFNNEKYVHYQRVELTYNYVNGKNLTDLSSWQVQDLSTNKLKDFIYTFQITEEDYALAEDL